MVDRDLRVSSGGDQVNQPKKGPDRVEPKSAQDREKFKKALEEPIEEEFAEVDEEIKGSIFDLSHKTAKKKPREHVFQKETLSDLGAIVPQKKQVIEGKESLELEEGDETTIVAGKHKKLDVSQETRPDLSEVQVVRASDTPITLAGVPIETEAVKGSQSLNRPEMMEMVEKMVEKITTMKSTGETSTEITLKTGGIFQGAKVVIKGFDHARGEFNLNFENLSPQAKTLIDLSSNRELLRSNLEEKGYIVHMINTNLDFEKTVEEQNLYARGDEKGDQQGQQEGQNPRDQEQERQKKE